MSIIVGIVGPMYGSPTEDECVQRGIDFNINVSQHVVRGFKCAKYTIMIKGEIKAIHAFAKSFSWWRWDWMAVK